MKVLGMFVPMNFHSFHDLITVFCWYVITFLDMLHTHVLHVVVVRFILSYSLLLQVVLMIKHLCAVHCFGMNAADVEHARTFTLLCF